MVQFRGGLRAGVGRELGYICREVGTPPITDSTVRISSFSIFEIVSMFDSVEFVIDIANIASAVYTYTKFVGCLG